MANKKQGNLQYIDTTANDIDTKSVVVWYALLTPSAAGGSVLLLDANAGNEILRFQGATANETKFYDFSRQPVTLSKGIHATVSNAKLTLLTRSVGSKS